MAKMVVVN
jgi:hypothetical protein